MLESSTGQWVAYVRLTVPPGLSPITTIGGVTAATCTPSDLSAYQWPSGTVRERSEWCLLTASAEHLRG
jgi:hypothetical protein